MEAFMELIQQAIRDRDLAFVTYNECDPAWEGVCWHRYQEAEARVQALLREARREGFVQGKDRLPEKKRGRSNHDI